MVRWFAPSPGGAWRYELELKFIETMPFSKTSSRSKPSRNSSRMMNRPLDWTTVYQGGETNCIAIHDLLPNSVYRCRVFALNKNGLRSEPSIVSQLCTCEASEDQRLSPSNAAEVFSVEVSNEGDVVVGDTVLFTERLILEGLRDGRTVTV